MIENKTKKCLKKGPNCRGMVGRGPVDSIQLTMLMVLQAGGDFE